MARSLRSSHQGALSSCLTKSIALLRSRLRLHLLTGHSRTLAQPGETTSGVYPRGMPDANRGKGRTGGITATELMAELAADPDYQACVQEQEAERQERVVLRRPADPGHKPRTPRGSSLLEDQRDEPRLGHLSDPAFQGAPESHPDRDQHPRPAPTRSRRRDTRTGAGRDRQCVLRRNRRSPLPLPNDPPRRARGPRRRRQVRALTKRLGPGSTPGPSAPRPAAGSSLTARRPLV